MANEMMDYLEARVAALEKYAMWVAGLPTGDACLALSRAQDEARKVLGSNVL